MVAKTTAANAISPSPLTPSLGRVNLTGLFILNAAAKGNDAAKCAVLLFGEIFCARSSPIIGGWTTVHLRRPHPRTSAVVFNHDLSGNRTNI